MSGWVGLLWIDFTFVKCMYCAHSVLLKSLAFTLYTRSLSPQALQSRSCLSYLSYATTAAESFEPSEAWLSPSLSLLYFFVSDFALTYVMNMFILIILYDFCFLPAQFCYIIIYVCACVRALVCVCVCVCVYIYIWKIESCVHLRKFPVVLRTWFVGTAVLRNRCLPVIPRWGKHELLLI
jgi:hypothetical protein